MKENQKLNTSIKILINTFKKYFPLNKNEIEEVSKLFKFRVLKRKSFILVENDVCKHYTFVVSGCLRMYALDYNFKEHNLQFAVEEDWIIDLKSFFSQQPSKLYIEAIEPSVILQIDHEDMLFLFTNYPKFDKNFRIIIEQKYIAYQERILQNISYTAEERYTTFIQDNPKLVNRLPNTQIASYLGITPEFLSKVRKNITLKRD